MEHKRLTCTPSAFVALDVTFLVLFQQGFRQLFLPNRMMLQ
jgi:hypothetical protein